jgi:PQQ-dependent dehydrogenase (s-GDH family)
MKNILLLLILMIATSGSCEKAKRNNFSGSAFGIQTKILVENLTNPWEIIWGPDNQIWMTERGGKLSRVNPQNGLITPVFTNKEVEERGEGGMLGMVLHPQFSLSPYVYIAYDYNKEGNYLGKIVRYGYDGKTLIDPLILLDNITAAGIHNGCRLLITPDMKLFITTGDASNSSRSQNLSSVNGKILRINLDGSIPSDNPFKGSPVWSFGHRNAQGLVYANNILYSSEHGPDSDDEVNIIEKGRNYGWPNVKGFCNDAERTFCSANNVMEPLEAWSPTLAVCGLDFYNKDLIPQWKNSLLMCTLKASKLVQLKLNETNRAIIKTTNFFNDSFGRLRDLCISPEGKVFICTSNGRNDKIIEISN